jgi:anti-sigma-K factor RskA
MSVDNNDREWLAMQYVLGELSDAERNALEERLPGDMQLCEAVTAASRLMLTAHAAIEANSSSTSIRPDSNQPRPGRSWSAVVATAAAMAMALLLVVRIPVKSPTDGRLANDSPQAAELVSLWRSGSDASDDDSDDLDDVVDDAADVAVPGWMLAAVSIEAGHPINAPSDQVQEN